LAAQDAALRGAGCAKVYSETASGAKTDRAALRKAVARLVEGDVLMVTRLDRLARSTRDLLNTLAEISKRGAAFKSLADVWADTTTPHGCLMLTVLGGVAEFERELIRSRTGEGRARAKAAGVHMGRPSKLTPHQRKVGLSLGICDLTNISPDDFERIVGGCGEPNGGGEDANKTTCNVIGVGAAKKNFPGIHVVKRILSVRPVDPYAKRLGALMLFEQGAACASPFRPAVSSVAGVAVIAPHFQQAGVAICPVNRTNECPHDRTLPFDPWRSCLTIVSG
jgi:hypothetical protein